MKTYSEKLKDPRWQRKRLEIFQRDDFKCCACGGSRRTLHVHHRYYVSHREPWEYPDFCYQTLCAVCHGDIKDGVAMDREDGTCLFKDWEVGLNYFGESLFDYMVQAETGWPVPEKLRKGKH